MELLPVRLRISLCQEYAADMYRSARQYRREGLIKAYNEASSAGAYYSKWARRLLFSNLKDAK